MKKYLTREEAMEHLRISNTQLWRLTSDAKLPYYQEKPGARMMFLEEDLDRYMDSIKTRAPGVSSVLGLSGTLRKKRVIA
ncbi:MAG TPA: helix-turn-helix domain-containing protein [Pseudoflavonifractor sp.]|nr:helix-turn-helix domain-containing protein [Pseudoflavonifractor sp.]